MKGPVPGPERKFRELKAEIISVGTELLLGHTIDTDAAYLSQELAVIGFDVLHRCTVGDNRGRLAESLRQALGRSDLVVLIGGLGPTGDDLTKETAAEVCGKHLVMDEESRSRIESYFRGRECGESQWKQAMLPEGCHVLRNDFGTAPGCLFRSGGGCLVALLPGPPSECEPMVRHVLIPALRRYSDSVIASLMVRTFGIGEGAAAERTADLMQSENPTVAPYAKESEMFLRVTAKAANLQEAESMCRAMAEKVTARLGHYVYDVNTDGSSQSCLEQTVVRLLTERGLTVSFAESCTGGLLAKRLTDIPGASSVLHMSFVTYANEAKHQLLGVPWELLEQYGAVSEPVARAMAEGVRRVSGSSIGVGVTGIAGPDGGTPEKPVGLVYLAVCDGTHTWVRRMNAPARFKSRASIRFRAASTALDLVRRCVCGLPMEEEPV